MIMTTITWLQIFATIFQLITSSSGACRDTNVGISDELRVIPDAQMVASSVKGPSFLAEFGRLHGPNAWCPDPGEILADGPYLQIDLGQLYDICGVEAQGEPGASETTRFSLSFSDDGGITFTDQQFDGSGSGSADGYESDFQELSPTVRAQYIRFHPVSESFCLRVEVYGTPVGVNVTCSETDIQVQIDESLDGSGSGLGVPTLIDSSDSRCQASSDGSYINFDFSLGICGTTIVISDDGDTAFYRNRITTADYTQFEIICSYIRTPTFLGRGSGEFNFVMEIFTDDSFMIPASGTILLSTVLHFRIEVETFGIDTEVHLLNCRATSSSDPDEQVADVYPIIEDGCQVASDSIVTEYDCTKTTNTQTFKFSVFRFAGSTPGDLIYFHCQAAVCLRSNTDSICTTECNACGDKRKKRYLEDYSRNDLAEENLVLGPYQIIDNDDDNDVIVDDGRTKGGDPSVAIADSKNFPVAMVIIVCIGSLVAIAIAIALFVTLRLSHSSRGPAVKNVTIDLVRENLAFDELDVKALSKMKT